MNTTARPIGDLHFQVIPGIPLIKEGDDLPSILLGAIGSADVSLTDGDVIVVAQKIVSKAEGRLVALQEVVPSEVARRLAAALTATAVLASYSRLLIDCNRPLDDHTSIREISDLTVVPGNRGLDGAVQRARAETFFWPYHAVLGRVIGRWRAQGIAPIVIAVHSYTPAMNGTERPWQLGILSNRDRRIANPLLAALAALPDLVIGDNQPYSGLEPYGYTVETHAIPAGLANVLLEFRQDEIEDEAGAHLWADRVAAALGPILEDRSLCRPFEG